MRQTSSEAYLLQTHNWFKQRNAPGPGSWAQQERDMLQTLQSSGDPFITKLAQGTPLFNTLAWSPRVDSREAVSQQRLQALQSFRDPFEDLQAFKANVSQIPAPIDPGNLQTYPQGYPVVGAPIPVSSNSVTASNAPEFMNPDPRLQIRRPPPEPGSMSERNPSSVPDVPAILPPPPGGPVPPPPSLPGARINIDGERKAAAQIPTLMRKLLDALKEQEGGKQPIRPPDPSTSRSGFPEGMGANAQILALRLRNYRQPEYAEGFAQFQNSIQRLNITYEGAIPFAQHLAAVKYRLQLIYSDTNIERYVKVMHLPFDGQVNVLYPWAASELIDKVNGIRETITEAEVLLVSWSAPVSEQNFLIFAKQYKKQVEGATQLLIRLFACDGQLEDSFTAPSLLPLPELRDLKAIYDVYEPRGASKKSSIGRELELWQAILNPALRTPGVDYSRGLDNPLLQEWVNYEPLNSRYASLTSALLNSFASPTSPEAASAIREFTQDLAAQVASLQKDLITQLVDRFFAINRMASELFDRVVNNAVTSEQEVVGFCVEVAQVQGRTFVDFTGKEVFKAEEGSSEAARKALNNKFKIAWDGQVDRPKEALGSMRSLIQILTHPNLAELLPEGFGAKTTTQPGSVKEILNESPFEEAQPRYDGGLVWHNSCSDCGLAVNIFCEECTEPYCNRCVSLHNCQRITESGVECAMNVLKLARLCQLEVPPHIAQVVVDDQAITVGGFLGQMLGFEYPCLQATQLHENANLFHLMLLTCGPRVNLSIRYLRVTIHSVLPILESDPIRVLINGAAVSEAKLYYGQTDGRAPQLRGRSVVIPEGAEISWLRETDQAWLHGSVANIELPPQTPVNIRLQLPIQLQSQGVLTKDVTASVEIVLTETPE